MNRFLALFPQLKDNSKRYKVHLATPYKGNDPLILFLDDSFEDWQSGQKKKNFEREYIISLISFNMDEWLFAGIYRRISCKWNDGKGIYVYETELLDINRDLIGRLIIQYNRIGRQPYLRLENCIEKFTVSQLLKIKYSISQFPGYEKTSVDFNELKIIITNKDSSWFTALKNVKGVYLITDKSNGKKYVGSASGEDAFWSRWSQYSNNGHGDNVELKKLIKKHGFNYAKENLQFSILEIRKDDFEIIEREKHWKNILLTKEHGYNQN